MQNSLFRRSLVYGLILLFIGLGATSSINGNIEIMGTLLAEESLNTFSFLDDGLIAYWSFDEGSGNITLDYSGHGYNGTIYGATWTTGYSGFALDFDGVDDYVSVDNHSENLGFNITDDYKISVWINSTSTDPGMIYDISDSSGINPGAHLELNSNGTLEIKIQVGDCEISVLSNGTYNDGLWHYVEVVFHGNPIKPTIVLFVDNQLIGSETDWACPFFAHGFVKAKIGRRSHNAIKYFDGVIDEVRVYKKPGGNQPPNPPTIYGPSSGSAFEEYTYTIVTTDPDGDNVYYGVDWGDGNITDWIGPYSSDEEVNVSHTWSENGTYEIIAKAKDTFDVSGWSDVLVVIIGNLAPDVPEMTGPPLGSIGVEYEYTFVTTDPNEDDIYLYIEWGDGQVEEWLGPFSSGDSQNVSHTWSEQGNYTIRAKAKDVIGAESEWGELEVTMPKNQQTHNTWFLHFVQNHPRMFPILRLLLGL